MTDDFAPLLGPRSIEDILAERVRLVIGGQIYDLPVLTIRENRAWRESLDQTLAFLLANLAVEEDTDLVLHLFDQAEVDWLTLLQTYDRTGVLPPRDAIEEGVTPLGLVRAVLEVWRAARPLADIAKLGMMPTTTSTSESPAPTSSWRQRMAGRLATLRMN